MLWPCIQRQILPRERCSRVAPLHSQVFPQVSAPGRIRTRDPLLRRQLLCPAELRAPEGNCARGRSRDGYARVADCRAFEAVPPRGKQGVDPEDFPKCQSVPQPAVSHRTRRPRPIAQPGRRWPHGPVRDPSLPVRGRRYGTEQQVAASRSRRYRPGPQSGSVAVSEPSSASWP
jgi:hypothetical protein